MSKFIKYINDEQYNNNDYDFETDDNEENLLLNSYDEYNNMINNIHKDIINYIEKYDLTFAEFLPKNALNIFIKLFLNQSK
jgi:hypothetical protein